MILSSSIDCPLFSLNHATVDYYKACAAYAAVVADPTASYVQFANARDWFLLQSKRWDASWRQLEKAAA